jgi:hypothetical protein
LGGEKPFGDDPEKQKIDRDQDNQCRQIKNDIPLHGTLRVSRIA